MVVSDNLIVDAEVRLKYRHGSPSDEVVDEIIIIMLFKKKWLVMCIRYYQREKMLAVVGWAYTEIAEEADFAHRRNESSIATISSTLMLLSVLRGCDFF